MVLCKLDDYWTSDHKLIIANIKLKIDTINREKTTTRDWRLYNKDAAQFVVGKKFMREYQEDMELEELENLFTKSFEGTQDELCPTRVVRTSRQTDLVDNEIERRKKKRKRTLHQLKKLKREGNLTSEVENELLLAVEILNREIKAHIKSSAKRTIRKKLASRNPKAFWNQIKKLEGDIKEERSNEVMIKDGKILTSPEDIANAFKDFFVAKVETLSKGEQAYQWIRSEESIQFEDNDIIEALSTYKGKLSSGPDNIMMKVIKDCIPALLTPFTKLMNMVAKKGMPPHWKLAKVRPLHKRGSRSEIENYRPISNLQSVSKVYEKLILNKIDKLYADVEGTHQHGFRKNRSTTTALLEMQSNIARNLDKGSFTACYSIDMSAAFDVLRPHIFHSLENNMPAELLNPVMDFLSNRQLYIEYKGQNSTAGLINVGCVQGSVLGPKLFAIYCKDLPSNLPSDCHITSYADDSYVTIHAINKNELKSKIEVALERHQDFMDSIGMVINRSKTELIVFDNNNEPGSLTLSNGISSKAEMKALGITFTPDLKWNKHLNITIGKATRIVNKIKFLRKWIDQDSAMQIVTSQFFGTLYYAAPVWLNEGLVEAQWKRLNSIHYRAIRATICDFKKKVPRSVLDIISKRATPKQWSRYVLAKTVIKLFNQNNTRIGQLLRENSYINDRNPGRASFFGDAKKKVGRNCLLNKLHLFNEIKFDWIGDISDDALRRKLKTQFVVF